MSALVRPAELGHLFEDDEFALCWDHDFPYSSKTEVGHGLDSDADVVRVLRGNPYITEPAK